MGVDPREWKKQHGGDCCLSLIHNLYVFPDGAACGTSHIGPYIEPDKDPYKRAQMQELYFKLKYQQVYEAYAQYKAQVKGHTQSNMESGAGPPRQLLDELKRRNAEANKWARKYRDAQANTRKARPESMMIDERLRAENQEQCEEFLNEISKY